MATSAFSTGISGVDPTRENTRIIGFVLRIFENAPFHPECSFTIASSAILAFGRFEVTQVLEYQHACLMLLGELDNASAHQVGDLLVCVADLLPEVGIVLFA